MSGFLFKAGQIVLVFLVVAVVITLPFMWLWNWVIVDVFGAREITVTEAMGLIVFTTFLRTPTTSVTKNHPP